MAFQMRIAGDISTRAVNTYGTGYCQRFGVSRSKNIQGIVYLNKVLELI